MNNEINQNELAHYGILGMKWGVRRTEAQLARLSGKVDKLKAKKKEQDKLTRAKNKLAKLKDEEERLKSALKNKPEKKKKVEDSPEPEKKKKVVKKKLSELSDDELNAMINRINLEQRYKLLISQNAPKEEKKKIFDGRSFMSKVTQQTAEDLTVQVTKHFGSKLLNKLIGEDVIYANNKKKS